MPATYVARLAEVQAAISSLLSGEAQSYTIDGRTVTKLDLAELYKIENDLRIKAVREQDGLRGGRFRKGVVS